MKLIKIILAAAALFAPFATATAQSFITNGLIDYYPFNGNPNDVAGTNNGVSYGATLTTNRFGTPNAAYLFNGSSSYIQTVHPMQDLTNATFSLWFNASVVGAGEVLLSDSDTAPGNDCNIQFSSSTVIGVVASKQGAGSGIAITNGSSGFTESIGNNWLHFVWVMQPTNQQIFVNGVQAANAYATANDVGYHGSGFLIGAGDSDFPIDHFFDGAISDVRIYNRALSPNEVAQLYAREANLPPALGITTYSNMPVVIFPTASGTNFTLQMTTNLNSPVWVAVTNGVPFSGFQITNAPPNAFFRLN